EAKCLEQVNGWLRVPAEGFNMPCGAKLRAQIPVPTPYQHVVWLVSVIAVATVESSPLQHGLVGADRMALLIHDLLIKGQRDELHVRVRCPGGQASVG